MIDVTIDDDALSMLKKTIDDRMEYKNKHNIKSMRISKKETDKQVWFGDEVRPHRWSRFDVLPVHHRRQCHLDPHENSKFKHTDQRADLDGE